MRTIKLLSLFVGFILMCSYYYEPEPELTQRPILMTREALETSIKYVSPKEMNNPGKIYLKDNMFFIVEKYKGIHVINNSDRRNPVKVGYIQIPGCMDLAIKGSTLYADNAVDLVAISLENTSNIQVTKRIKNSFPEITPPGWDYIPHSFNKENRPEGTIIVAWE